jgi:hypothetical protein
MDSKDLNQIPMRSAYPIMENVSRISEGYPKVWRKPDEEAGAQASARFA